MSGIIFTDECSLYLSMFNIDNTGRSNDFIPLGLQYSNNRNFQ